MSYAYMPAIVLTCCVEDRRAESGVRSKWGHALVPNSDVR